LQIGILGIVAPDGQIVEANTWIAHVAKQRFRVIGARVPDNDDLETLIGLPEDGGYASLHEQLAAIVGGYQD
jgi:hypothetical protein